MALAVHLPTLDHQVVADGGQFLYMGETIRDGGVPYVDAANNKGPVLYLLFALFDAIVGTSSAALRLTQIPFLAAAALGLAAYVARYAGRLAGGFAGVLFASITALESSRGMDIESEQYGVAPMFCALALAVRPGARLAAAAGALVSTAALINPTFALVAPFVAFEAWKAAHPDTRRRKTIAALALGAAAPLLATVAWLGPLGALDDMVTQVGGQISQAGGAIGGRIDVTFGIVENPSVWFLPSYGLWGLAALSFVAALRARSLWRPALVLAGICGAVLLRIKLAHYELPYQYYPALPALAGLLALALAALVPDRPRTRLAAALAALALIQAAVILPLNHIRLAPPEDRAQTATGPVAAFIRRATEPGDTLVAAGAHAELYWLAGRRAPNRFFDIFGLLGSRRYPAQRDRQLARRPPDAVAFVAPRRLWADPPVEELVRRGPYELAYSRDGSTVWLRRP